MKLDALKPLLDHDGPLTTVCLDVTRADEAGDRELRHRWQLLRRTLEHQGAPPTTVEAIAEVVLRPTHVPGPHGRFVVASGSQVLFDRVLADAPAREEAFHDGVPALMPAAQAQDEAVRYLLVEVDRTGADLIWSGVDKAEHADDTQVDGGHDLVHKSRSGDWWSSRRAAARIEDSWERNAEAVAHEIDRAVAEHHPELVLLTGDVRAVALIRSELGKAATELVVEVAGGSRADGVKADVFAANLHEVVEAYRDRRRRAVVERLSEGLGRADGAVTELGDVIAVLRRGQVAELVVLEDEAGRPAPLDTLLWVGPGPLEIAERRSELAALGVTDADARQQRADIALLRAAVAQDAGVTFAKEGTVGLVDGVGALLRWSDQATPHEGTQAYTASHRRRARG